WQARVQDTITANVASSSDQIRAQVKASAHAATEKILQDWQPKLQQLAENAAASASDQVQGQIKDALSAMEAKIKEMQERAVTEGMDTLRGRLSQFLGLLQGGG